mmetsp:Transcript_70528/g.151983  ORF Transcript_70528/g.151983 Transcript_70528/m.151983 type:complete len:259 (-) Transcript_70528:436-1212(-)
MDSSSSTGTGGFMYAALISLTSVWPSIFTMTPCRGSIKDSMLASWKTVCGSTVFSQMSSSSSRVGFVDSLACWFAASVAPCATFFSRSSISRSFFLSFMISRSRFVAGPAVTGAGAVTAAGLTSATSGSGAAGAASSTTSASAASSAAFSVEASSSSSSGESFEDSSGSSSTASFATSSSSAGAASSSCSAASSTTASSSTAASSTAASSTTATSSSSSSSSSSACFPFDLRFFFLDFFGGDWNSFSASAAASSASRA